MTDPNKLFIDSRKVLYNILIGNGMQLHDYYLLVLFI
jgi:hypothetical protein